MSSSLLWMDWYTLLAFAYLTFVLLLLTGWEKLPLFYPESGHEEVVTSVSIIIPVRNEEENIGKLLQMLGEQHYPRDKMEIIIVDDFSSDNTFSRVEASAGKASFPVRILKAKKDQQGNSGKKQAIATGIAHSRGSLIITTDGDCLVGPDWIKTMEEFYRSFSCKMVCGPVFIESQGTLFGEMQRIEFSSLIGSGAASLNLGFPSMCNGANLAYSREVFEEVGGFEGNEHIASGDDEFLMHKVYQRYPEGVKFLKSREAIVTTLPQPDVRSFISQRRRWASKWSHYRQKGPKVLAIFIFSVNFFLLAGGLLCLSGNLPPLVFFEQILIKILAEFVFLKRVQRFSGKKMNGLAFVLLEIIYPFYVILTGLSGIVKGYRWKDRNIKT